MRTVLTVILSIVILFSYSQSRPIDIPDKNLYVFLVDKSGSMARLHFGGNIANAKSALSTQKIYSILAGQTNLDFKSDFFSFYTFGLGNSNSISDLKKANLNPAPFSEILIHNDSVSTGIAKLKDSSELYERLLTSLSNSARFDYSFTSLAKYLGLKNFLDNNNESKTALLSIRNIFVCVITDNGEDNYQWFPDRDAIKFVLFNKDQEILESINLLETNSFDPHSKRWAVFKELYIEKDKGIKYNLYQFQTALDTQFSSIPSIELKQSKIRFKINGYSDSLPYFIKINSGSINGIKLEDTILKGDLTLLFPQKLNWSNSIVLNLTQYEPYLDSILGKRYRVKDIMISESLWSPNAKNAMIMIALAMVILIALISWYLLIYRPNRNVLVVTDAFENEIKFTRKDIKSANSKTILQYLNWINTKTELLILLKLYAGKYLCDNYNSNNTTQEKKGLWIRIDTMHSLKLSVECVDSINTSGLDNGGIDEKTKGKFGFRGKIIEPKFHKGNVIHIFPDKKDLFEIRNAVLKFSYSQFSLNFKSINETATKGKTMVHRLISHFVQEALKNSSSFNEEKQQVILKSNVSDSVYWLAFEIETPNFFNIKHFYTFNYTLSHSNNNEMEDNLIFEQVKKDSGWQKIKYFDQMGYDLNASRMLNLNIYSSPCTNFIYLAYPERFNQYKEDHWKELECIFDPFVDFGKVIVDIPPGDGKKRAFKGGFANIKKMKKPQYLIEFPIEPIERSEVTTLQVDGNYIKLGPTEIDLN
jgi:hypothetical protein